MFAHLCRHCRNSTQISEAYADLRARVSASDRDRARTLPITARTLETMIRLASAHAKCHLRALITDEDAKAAIELLHYALFSESRQSDTAMGDADTEGKEGAEGESTSRKRPATGDEGATAGGRQRTAQPASPYSKDELEKVVEDALSKLFSGNRDDCSFDELFTSMGTSDTRLLASGREAVESALDAMEAANKVMHREGRIHLI